MNIYIVYEINLWNYVDSSDLTLENSLFCAVKLVKNADIDKYKYSGHGIGFNMKGIFSFPTGEFGKNVIIFRADMILGECPTQGLDNTILTAEKTYSINFTEHNKNFCLSLHYNRENSYLFVNGREIHKFKAKDSEINASP